MFDIHRLRDEIVKTVGRGLNDAAMTNTLMAWMPNVYGRNAKNEKKILINDRLLLLLNLLLAYI